MITPVELSEKLVKLRYLAIACGGPDWFVQAEVVRLVEDLPFDNMVFNPTKYIFSLNNILLLVVPNTSESALYKRFYEFFSNLNEDLALMDTAWRLVGSEVVAE
jgi:hypothetical protein